MKAIINIHHDGHRSENENGNWLDITKAASNAAANEAIKAQLSAMWTQIAESFKEKWGDEDHLRRVFADLKDTYVDKGIPVYIGEMGCVHRSDSRSESFRKYYLEYLCKAARTYGMAAFYWDNGSTGTGHESSGLFDHATGNYVNNGKDIVEVMKRGYFTTDTSYTLETVYHNAPQ